MALDLRHLDLTGLLGASLVGMIPKAYSAGKFYKTPNYNASCGFYGLSSVNDVVATRYLNSVGIQCLEYDGALAAIRYQGAEYTAFVSWSEDYRDGRADMGLAHYLLSSDIPAGKGLEFMQKRYPEFLNRLFVADYLVGNRDRHGSNIRVYSDGSPCPLFDFNLSLFMPDGQSRQQDILANNYLGFPSLLDNLELVTSWPATKDPDWDYVFKGITYPYEEELKSWLNWRRYTYETIRSLHAVG